MKTKNKKEREYDAITGTPQYRKFFWLMMSLVCVIDMVISIVLRAHISRIALIVGLVVDVCILTYSVVRQAQYKRQIKERKGKKK